MKFSRFIFIIFLILYIFLLTICIKSYLYIRDIEMIIFWTVSFLLNIGIIIFYVKKELRLSMIICCIIFINFILLALFLFLHGNSYYLKQLTLINKIFDYLFTLCLVIVSGNWLLPIIYHVGTKGIVKHQKTTVLKVSEHTQFTEEDAKCQLIEKPKEQTVLGTSNKEGKK